jgi:lipoprotein-anchoring transpeptidase ErfK/SrfK
VGEPAEAWAAYRAPTNIVPAHAAPVIAEVPSEPVELPVEPTVAARGNVQAIPVVAPAVSSFVASHAASALAAREVPVSWDPRTSTASQGSGEAPLLATPAQQASLLADEVVGRASIAQKRLFGTVPDDIEPYFDLFMYVSKAKRGPLAQHMFVFQRDADGRIIPYAEWKVSTGREKFEINNSRRVRTTTPEGIFQLDPDRFHKRYWSRSWDNAPMHYAMFYDMMNNGRQTGLAIHAAIGKSKIDRLGRRDSAGCVRLAPKNAKELFFKVQTATRGRVPVLSVNERGSTDRWGRVQRDENGAMLLQDGYRAVLFVENFDGREEISGPVVAYLN